MKVIKSIHKLLGIESIGFNIDYTPYAIKRDNEIKEWCHENNVTCYFKEDYPLYDILSGQTNKADGTPYLVYTPFLKHLTSTIPALNYQPVLTALPCHYPVYISPCTSMGYLCHELWFNLRVLTFQIEAF